VRSANTEPLIVENALAHYDDQVRGAFAEMQRNSSAAGGNIGEMDVGRHLPAPGPEFTAFRSASDIAVADLGEYHGRRLRLLDLMRNAGTRTTKTFPSLLIVARAAEHVRRTGERVMIVTPSSGNKATALRDAVLTAHRTGLATPDELSIMVLVPAASRDKLWASPLDEDNAARHANPVAVYPGTDTDRVKVLARSMVDRCAADLREKHGVRLWYTLDLANYRIADTVRALVEHDYLPAAEARLHVHAVSSAFGLLGHDLGVRRLAAAGHRPTPSRYLLVQHLDTADMVLSLRFGSTAREAMPAYRFDAATGHYHQDDDPHFPSVTASVTENLDPTFYTRNPITSPEMNALIGKQGGDGIVVSRYECLQRYPALREMLAPTGYVLPAEPADLREWSLVMALTGILNAIDRDLVREPDVLVHGSGSYGVADFTAIPAGHLHSAADVDDLAAIAYAALEHEAVR
jgi:hypothetical protein